MTSMQTPNLWRQAHLDELDRLFAERTTFEADPLKAAFERGQRSIIAVIRQKVQQKETIR